MSTSRKLPAWRGARARRARRGRGRPWRRGERRAAARGGWRRCPCPRRGTPGTPTARASRPPGPAPCGRSTPPPPSTQLLQPPRKETTPGPDGTRRRRPGSRGRSPPSRRSVVDELASREIFLGASFVSFDSMSGVNCYFAATVSFNIMHFTSLLT
jgi:hypothetical protein